LTDLVQSISIDNMLNQRNAIVSAIASARAELFKAQSLCDANAVDLSLIIASRHDSGCYPILREDTARDNYLLGFTQRLDAQLWQRLMHESGLRTFLDSLARDEWDKAIRDIKTPELTRANIEATFSRLNETRGEMFERGVIEVFKCLSWDYKSNMPHKFGKRMIVEFFMNSYGVTTGYARADRLADMERVMYMLDGKPVPDHRSGIVQKCGDVQRQWMKSSNFKREAEDAFFRVKWFKNRNGHFIFKRPDLVDRMNKILAKHYPDALPPAI
jgi:hypothetical protein